MNTGTVFLIILAVILLGLTILFLVLWLRDRKSSTENNPNDLVLTGLNVRLTAPDTVTATWTSAGVAGNTVTAFADTQKIELDSAGRPTKSSSNILTGGPVPESAKTVSISGLSPNTKYYIDIVTSGDNRHKATTALVWTGTIPPTEFKIEELNTGGGIELGSDNASVTFQTKLLNKNNDDLWSYNSQTFKITGNGAGSNADPVLYNNSGTLAATTNASILTPANSEWTYNANGQNRWCLKSSPDVCLQVSDLTASGSPITVTTGGTSQWLNKGLLLNP